MTGSSTKSVNWRPLALLLVVAGAMLVILFRLVPYGIRGVNFAPVGALLLFAGARLRPWYLLLVIFAPVLAVDLYFYSDRNWPMPLVSYVSYFVYIAMGCFLLRRTESPVWIVPTTLAASVQFFIITNFGVWLEHVAQPEHFTGEPYQFAATPAGLGQCFEVAIPFFRGTLISDVLFAVVFFAAHAVLARAYFPAERVTAETLPETDK